MISDRQVFSADLAYDRHHCYLADGFHQEWLQNLGRARAELPAGVTLHPGHGEPCGAEVLDWQERYINTFLAAVANADWSDAEGARAAVIARMLEYLPSGALQFLMKLSIDPVGSQLGGASRCFVRLLNTWSHRSRDRPRCFQTQHLRRTMSTANSG